MSAPANMLRKAPVPAWVITPGTITNTDEAGVMADKVSSNTPIKRMLRFNGFFFCACATLASAKIRSTPIERLVGKLIQRRPSFNRNEGSAFEHLQRYFMHALVARHHDAAAGLRRTILPRRDDTAGADNDRDQRHDVVRLDLGLDDEVDLARRQHAIGIAIAAVTREFDRVLDAHKIGAVRFVHQ